MPVETLQDAEDAFNDALEGGDAEAMLRVWEDFGDIACLLPTVPPLRGDRVRDLLRGLPGQGTGIDIETRSSPSQPLSHMPDSAPDPRSAVPPGGGDPARDPQRQAPGHAAAPPPGTPRVRLHSLGCRLNEAELEAWAEDWVRRGWALARDGEPADLVVVNTCAVTAEAARKSRQVLRRFRRTDPGARVVATGCQASLEWTAGGAAGWGPGPSLGPAGQGRLADLIVPNSEKDRLVEIAAAALESAPAPAGGLDPAGRSGPQGSPSASPPAAPSPAEPLLARGRQRAFVKVQDGCRYSCTFCVTTLARGSERSRPLRDVIDGVNRLVQAGIREAVLTGVHLGGYGSDLGRGVDLTLLVRTLLAETDIARLRLSSLEPWGIGDPFWELFADARLMPHLHLPMQSGSQAVLRRMARRCRPAEFLALAARGRAAVPGLQLGTDILVGFPGEREDDWRTTLDFVVAAGFAQVHVFPFSPRPGTRAAELSGRVDAPTCARRTGELRRLAGRLRRAAMERAVGDAVEVLREGTPRGAPPGTLFGSTPGYLPVRIETAGAAPVPVGEILKVELIGVTPDGEALRGRPLVVHGG